MYQVISMKDAQYIFENDPSVKILDVRHADEFAWGHIPHAVLYDNDLIDDQPLEPFPDLDERIYVYCRSGYRAHEACRKMEAIGYTNLVHCGGIIEWKGMIER